MNSSAAGSHPSRSRPGRSRRNSMIASSVSAPDAIRIAVNDAGSIDVVPIAIRASRELPAKASIATHVSSATLPRPLVGSPIAWSRPCEEDSGCAGCWNRARRTSRRLVPAWLVPREESQNKGRRESRDS